MEESILSSVVLPASLFIIMLGMGLSLETSDFRRVIRMPKAALVGFVNQLVFLPLIGLAICILFNLPPVLAVGLMVLAACPGGVTSNLISHVAKGDLALSISLTAVTSFITVITIPLITSFSLEYFLSANEDISSPVKDIMIQVFGITVLPVSIGMIIRRRSLAFARRMEAPMRVASVVIFIAVVVGLIVKEHAMIADSFASVGLATMSLNIITMILGFFSARALKLKLPQAITITVETGIQNGTLAIVIALSILGNSEMSIPAAVYSLIMFATGGLIMLFFGRRKTDVA